MNEFEWRRQMRDLRQPLTPRRDLWASIDAALDKAESTSHPVAKMHRRSRPLRWLIAAGAAASVALMVVTGFHARPGIQPVTASRMPLSVPGWKPADPRLAGAATQLNAAQMELRQAIEQAPHSPALQRLLMRTEQQQAQLRQLVREAG